MTRFTDFLRQEASNATQVAGHYYQRLIDLMHERGDEFAHHVAARGDPELATSCLQGYFRLLALDRAAKEPDGQAELFEQF